MGTISARQTNEALVTTRFDAAEHSESRDAQKVTGGDTAIV